MALKSLAGLAVGFLTAATAVAEPLRVMTYNLRYITAEDTGPKAWSVRRDQAANLIKADAPDIVGIQEGLPQMMNDLMDRLPGYVVIGVGREDGSNRGEYAAILLKADRFRIQETGTFWLSDTPELPNSHTWGNTVTRICTWAKLLDRRTGKTFHFFNTHLDHMSQEARQKGTELILARIAKRQPAGPVVFTGDFNAAEDNSVHAAIKASGLVDVWRTLNPDIPAAESGTSNRFKGIHDGSRIDYIYASSEFKPTAAEIIHTTDHGNCPSDHFPVRATLE